MVASTILQSCSAHSRPGIKSGVVEQENVLQDGTSGSATGVACAGAAEEK